MPIEPVDYAATNRKVADHPLALLVPIVLFVGAMVLMDWLLINLGNDRTPGSWADFVVLVLFNPGGHLMLAIAFLIPTFICRRRVGDFLALYIPVALFLPLIGALVVYACVGR